MTLVAQCKPVIRDCSRTEIEYREIETAEQRTHNSHNRRRDEECPVTLPSIYQGRQRVTLPTSSKCNLEPSPLTRMSHVGAICMSESSYDLIPQLPTLVDGKPKRLLSAAGTAREHKCQEQFVEITPHWTRPACLFEGAEGRPQLRMTPDNTMGSNDCPRGRCLVSSTSALPEFVRCCQLSTYVSYNVSPGHLVFFVLQGRATMFSVGIGAIEINRNLLRTASPVPPQNYRRTTDL